jgi:AsmA protein
MASKRRWPLILGGIFVLLIVLLMVALWQLDAILLRTAREQAATYSQKLGRPIAIGDISTKLFPFVGAEVKDVSVGAAEGEPAPLAQLQRITVSVATGPLIRSRGHDIQVKNAELEGLTVNVVRFKDGTTNVQRLTDKLAEEKPAPAKPEPTQPEQPKDLSGVRVDRAALKDGTIRLIDQSAGAARELAIKHLDVEVKDLRVGEPLVVKLAAAVLADKQNLNLELDAAPLPPTLMPTPKKLTLKADHIDLAPLGPFLPPSVGLQAGTLDANWTAELGAAVPGGEGPTHLTGTLAALGLKFSKAEVAKPLDVRLDTDVTGDVNAGDLSLDKLRVDLGPAGITGKGKVKGLVSGAPSVEGFELVAHDFDPAVIAQYYPPLRAQLKGMVSGPIGLSVRGSGTQAQQAIDLVVDLTPVKLRVPQQLTKEAGAPMKLTARVSGAAASGGALRFNVQGDLTGADLRPGLTLDKAPGQRLTLAADGSYKSQKGATQVDVKSLSIGLPEDTLTGTASVALAGAGKAKSTHFAVDLKAPKLDADKLLLTNEEVMARNGGKLPPPSDDPHRFDGMSGDVRAQIGALRYSKMDLQNVVVVAKMQNDQFTVEKFSAGVFGGSVSADGTTISLGPKPEARPFHAIAKINNVDINKALVANDQKPVMGGAFNGSVDVQGVGTTPEHLKQSLGGAINGNVLNGTFLGADLLGAATGPLTKALPFTAKALSDKGTSLGDKLPFGVHIANGVALLDKPISWTRPQAAMSFSGGMKLDGTLDLAGVVNLTPATIKAMTGGKVTPSAPVPINLKVVGPAASPQVTGVDVKPAAELIAKQAATSLAGKLIPGKAGKEIQGILGGGGTDQAKQEAQQKAQQQAAEQQKKAEDAAKAQQKKLEDEAKKRLQGIFGH